MEKLSSLRELLTELKLAGLTKDIIYKTVDEIYSAKGDNDT